jgi:hypothetical protein
VKQSIEMPEVMKCEANSCAYNVDSRCHARGITVGDIYMKYLCDTLWKSKQHTHRRDGAGVGACRATNCLHNDDLECQASGIHVVQSGDQAQCGTFSPR